VSRPDGNTGWCRIPFPEPRQLYGLERLAADPGAQVIVVEDEKAADAAHRMLPMVAITWPGGTNGYDKVDWSPLRGRNVILMPDADWPGLEAMVGRKRHRTGEWVKGIGELLLDVEVASLKIVDTLAPDADGVVFDNGWDVADAERDGWTQDQLIAWIRPRVDEFKRPVPASADECELDLTAEEREAAEAALEHVPAPPPDIKIVPGELPRVVDEAEAALIAASPNLFQRGSWIVRPATAKITVADGREIEGIRLVRANKHHLVERMTASATWHKHDGRKKGGEQWVAVDCPLKIAETYLAREGLWKLPTLAGMINAPTLRRDGSILEVPGYDPATGLL
jgi:hypothetical protein